MHSLNARLFGSRASLFYGWLHSETLGTTEPASRDLKPSDRFLRSRRDRTQHRELPLGVTPLQVPRSGRRIERDAVNHNGS